MKPPGLPQQIYPSSSRQRHRAARGRRDPRHKGGPGTGEPSGCRPGAKLPGLIRGRPRPSPPRGARRGPGLTGAQKGGRREGWTDRRLEWRAQETRRAAEALPRPRYVTMRPGGRRRSPGPPTGSRGRGHPGRRGAEPRDATTTRGRPTDSDRPLCPGPAHAPCLQPPSRVSPAGEPAAYAYLARSPPPPWLFPQGLLLSSPPTFVPLFPLTPPPAASPLASLPPSTTPPHPPLSPSLSSLKMKSPLTGIHESTAATSLVPKPFQGSSLKPGKDSLGEKKGGHGPGKLLCLRSVLAVCCALARVFKPQPSPLQVSPTLEDFAKE